MKKDELLLVPEILILILFDLCCLTTPGLKKDIWRQIQELSSFKYTRIKLFLTTRIITYYHHFHYHILTFISITNLFFNEPGLDKNIECHV